MRCHCWSGLDLTCQFSAVLQQSFVCRRAATVMQEDTFDEGPMERNQQLPVRVVSLEHTVEMRLLLSDTFL